MTTIIPRNGRVDVARGDRSMSIALPAPATGGTLSVLEAAVPAGQAGPPRHRHPASDETFVVLDGALLLATDGGVRRLEAGGTAFVPRGEVHTFAAPPDTSVRFLTVHTPGGFEAFHVAAEQEARARGRALDRDELAALATGFDWVAAGPPIDPAVPVGAAGR